MKRVKTPTIIQMELAECGAASLGIVLGYFGKYLTLEELRIRCGVSRDGSNAQNIFSAAESYGLITEAYKMELDGLKEVQGPAILYWGFNHFVVFEGWVKNKIYINDPNTGPRTITLEELDREFTGVVLTFKPGASFKKSGRPDSLIQTYVNRIKWFKPTITFLVLTGFGLILPGLALPTLIRIFVDNIFIGEMRSWQSVIILALAVTLLFTGILTFLQSYYLNRLQQKLSIIFSSKFLWHILRLPMSYYSQRFGGEIAYRMTLNNEVAASITGPLATTIIDFVLVAFYGFLMFRYDAMIALIAVVFAIVNIFVMIVINNSRKNAFACLQQDLGKSLGISIDALQSIETVKSMGSESDFFTRWAGYYAKTINANQNIGKKDIYLTVIPQLLQGLTIACLLYIGAWRVIEGDLTIGMLMALQSIVIAFLLPINRFVDFGMLIQNTKIMINRLDDVLNNAIDVCYHKNKKALQLDKLPLKLAGHLEFQNVSYGYSPLDPPLIENFSFKLNPGQRVALVGHSGCGKSTVAKLATYLRHPWSGTVLYDSKPFDAYPREFLNRSMASVDQEIFLFAGSIRDNLTLWDRTIPEERLIRACKDACIHEDIISRPDGYDTLLDEKGRNLSGGQRQRLEIARALIQDPTILVMDEATSALDSETEKIVMNNIYRRGCTCIIIAHRLSSIKECDEIIVFQKGVVKQRGSHEALKNQEGLYRELTLKEGLQNA